MGKSWFVAGATARDLVLHGVFGRQPSRATRDIDIAIFVASWEEFEQTKEFLRRSGFKLTTQQHRLTETKTNLPVDIIPFGQLANELGQIQWPPGHEITMSVVGFQEAFATALTISHQGQVFKAASLPGIVLLKLVAWDERGMETGKDATDFYTIMDKYQFIHNDRIREDCVPAERWGYKDEFSAAFLLGLDVKDLLSDASRAVLQQIRANKQDGLIAAITRAHNTLTIEEVEAKLAAFWQGLVS